VLLGGHPGREYPPCFAAVSIRRQLAKMTTFDALHRLIKAGDILSVRRELDAGANPNLVNQFGWSLLMSAALEGNASIGELLLSRGAEVNTKNTFGETALSLAAHGGHLPFIRILLANGGTAACRPHGASLENWLRVGSRLTESKIASILALIKQQSPG
jgi:ankyrin repeat protein